MKTKDTFIVYREWTRLLTLLTDREAGRLFRVILDYAFDGIDNSKSLNDKTRVAVPLIFAAIDRDSASWADKCRARSEAGKLGASVTNSRRQKPAFAGTAPANSPEPVPVPVHEPEPVHEPALAPVPVPVPASTGDAEASEAAKGSIFSFPVMDTGKKPTPGDVKDYFTKMGFVINADEFCRFMDSENWCVGGKPVVSWHALAKRWNDRELRDPTPKKSTGSFDTDEFFEAALARGMRMGLTDEG